MTTEGKSSFVRLRVEVVLEIADAPALVRTATARVEGDELIPDEEREHALSAVTDEAEGAAEAIAYLVDPIDLVGDAPGVELAQATWSSETIDYDPETYAWLSDETGSDFGADAVAADAAVPDAGLRGHRA